MVPHLCNCTSSDQSVVLLDELDQLVMARQTVLYNLFNWPTLPNSRLIVVAISNTMNLTDMLPNKIQSRVGIYTHVNFTASDG
jgi:origin recognition complex subunit 1